MTVSATFDILINYILHYVTVSVATRYLQPIDNKSFTYQIIW